MVKLLLVGAGGFLGSVGRYLLASAVNRWLVGAFPGGTLAVNVLGCFLIGVLMSWAQSRQFLGGDLWLFLGVGILGGFTTFSAFGNETLELLRDSRPGLAIANIAANVLLGLAAVWLGRLAFGPHAT